MSRTIMIKRGDFDERKYNRIREYDVKRAV